MKLNIAILGTRGIPNHYGGFEHITAHLATALAGRGHSVTVYCSGSHPYSLPEWNGVNLVHCYDPEARLGTAGQFIYDLNCIMDARKRPFDVWLFMGYTSSSVWGAFYSSRPVIISNMDGLEWMRSKYARPVRVFLRLAERLAIQYSNYLVADSPVIRSYLDKSYKVDSRYIPYGAVPLSAEEEANAGKHNTEPAYAMLMARMEPENNIEMVLLGFSQSNTTLQLKVLGNTGNKYGQYLVQKFGGDKRIAFLGGLFDNATVRTLQHNAALYFHGHSVGGTNPSLLEAMATKALIAAHNNAFNYTILSDDAFYFSCPADVTRLLEQRIDARQAAAIKAANLQKIQLLYNWQDVTSAYENYILQCYQANRNANTV